MEGLITIAHGLGMDVVVEGVETGTGPLGGAGWM